MVEELILEETKTKLKLWISNRFKNFRHEIRVLFYLQSSLVLCESISFKCGVSSIAVVISSGNNVVYIGQSLS